jgi:hypothetical protein
MGDDDYFSRADIQRRGVSEMLSTSGGPDEVSRECLPVEYLWKESSGCVREIVKHRLRVDGLNKRAGMSQEVLSGLE